MRSQHQLPRVSASFVLLVCDLSRCTQARAATRQMTAISAGRAWNQPTASASSPGRIHSRRKFRRKVEGAEAQTIPAIVFANTTRTSIGGLRDSMQPSHVPGCGVAMPFDDDAGLVLIDVAGQMRPIT